MTFVRHAPQLLLKLAATLPKEWPTAAEAGVMRSRVERPSCPDERLS